MLTFKINIYIKFNYIKWKTQLQLFGDEAARYIVKTSVFITFQNKSLTCKMVKFSRTLFIMYFSGRCLSLCIKLIIYSHIGLLWILYTNRPFSYRAYSVSTFSTTCLPKEHTFVEHVIVMFSLLSYLQRKCTFSVT